MPIIDRHEDMPRQLSASIRPSPEIQIRKLIFFQCLLDVPNREIIREISNIGHPGASDFGGLRPLTVHRGAKSGQTHSCCPVCEGKDDSEREQGGRGDD